MFNNIIKRKGYGSNFNVLYYNDDKSLIKKMAINKFGINKLNNEINFYNFIKKNNINFNIPIIYFTTYNYIIMNYIIIQEFDILKHEYLFKILKELNKLHNIKTIKTNKEYYKKIFLEETIEKIKTRYNEVKDIVLKYEILSVNNINLYDFELILLKLETNINNYINSKSNYELNIIHGDPQFNNILLDTNNEIIFIDPKGSFGSSLIYGIKEYDIAKIYCSLSGYYIFDNMEINNININNKNLNINFINLPNFQQHIIYMNEINEMNKINEINEMNKINEINEMNKINEMDDKQYDDILIIILFITIWLSNSHVFINEPYKAIYSHYIGMYFATCLLSH